MSKISKMVLLASLIGALSSAAVASAATGFLKGETSEGFNKICYYDVLGDTHTKNISSVSICPMSISVNKSYQPLGSQMKNSFGRSQLKQSVNRPFNQPFQNNSLSIKKTGFLSGERASGLNKICFYDVLGDTHSLNISSVSICPLTAKF